MTSSRGGAALCRGVNILRECEDLAYSVAGLPNPAILFIKNWVVRTVMGTSVCCGALRWAAVGDFIRIEFKIKQCYSRFIENRVAGTVV